MKTSIAYKRGSRGTAMVVVLALLAIMGLFLVINAQTLHLMKRELLLIEKKQVEHWVASNAGSKP